MRFAAIVLLLSLSACQPPVADDAAIQANAEPSPIVEDEWTPLEKPAPAPKSVAKVAPEPIGQGEPMHGEYPSEEELEASWRAQRAERGLCWHGYCPCERPVNALDRTICRNARGGVEMSDDQWSIGAMARDLKRDGDESNRQMDEVMRDARSQRQQLWNSQRSGTAPAPDSPPEGADQDSGESFD